ncbi:MAG: HEAT repeat domain-containing protein, partial [Candidatus Hodarchaeota archaeon]
MNFEPLIKLNTNKLISNQDVNELVRIILHETDAKTKSKIIKALGTLKDPRAVFVLIKALKDESMEWKREVINALVEIGEPAVDPLIEVLEDKNRDCRLQAIHALGRIGNARAITPLIQTLKDDIDRWATVRALAKIGEPVVDPILQKLNDENFVVRWGAIEALGEIKHPKAVRPLIQILNGEDTALQVIAVSALGKIKDEKAFKALVQALENKHSNVREKVVRALGQQGNSGLIELLIPKLKDESWDVRIVVASVLE